MSKSFPLSFKALFKVESITVLHPLVLLFPNSSSCQAFSEFITDTILDRVANGSLSVWERVGEVPPSHLVMPITVEPSKPSVCQHDERFFNLWIKYLPFSLDLITDLPRNVHKGSFQITCDDKSGYDHIRLSPDSRTWFGLWNAWYFVFNTLPFGWKANTYLYHSIGVVATSFIRSHGVPCSQYIDDRHFGELQIRRNAPPCLWSDFQRAQAALYIACYIFIDLRYFIGLEKSSLVPTQKPIIFLGYVIDSVKTAFLMPLDKKITFASLGEHLLSHKTVSLRSLQKFVGKINSFTLVVLAARLYSGVSCLAMSKASKSYSRFPRLKGGAQAPALP